MSEYSKKMILLDQNEFTRLKKNNPSPDSKMADDIKLKEYNQRFLENKIENKNENISSWNKLGSNLKPILRDSFTSLGTTAAPQSMSKNSPTNPQSPSSSQAQAQAQSPIKVASNIEKNINYISVKTPGIKNKALKLFALLNDEYGDRVSFGDSQMYIDGEVASDDAARLLVELVKGGKTLRSPPISLFQLLSSRDDINHFIYNKQARNKINNISNQAESSGIQQNLAESTFDDSRQFESSLDDTVEDPRVHSGSGSGNGRAIGRLGKIGGKKNIGRLGKIGGKKKIKKENKNRPWLTLFSKKK